MVISSVHRDAAVGTLTASHLAACRPEPAITRRAVRRLRAKAALIMSIVIGSYIGLVMLADGPLLAVPLAAALVVGIVATGTGVMHDANHGAFGRPRVLGAALAFSADALGASSWFWRQKHNVIHHGNTNVVGVDTDIEQMPFARLAPAQPWQPWHRYQHLYMWPLYGMLAIRMLLLDSVGLLNGRVGSQPLVRQPRRRDIVVLLTGKWLHVAWALAVPMLFHPWWVVLVFYAACSWCVGVVLAVFFQLAHCNDLVDFAAPTTERRGGDFFLHQLRTTANVRTRGLGRPVGWLMGGLNRQIEHHLAPAVPHPAYPCMAERLREVCARGQLGYHVHPSFTAALRSHGRWLRAMGRRPTPIGA